MVFVTADRVKETTTTTGTGNITLAGAVPGFRAFSSIAANNDVLYYTIAHQTPGEWEVGLGTWQTGGTLVRTTVLASSNGGALVNFSAGTKDIFLTAAADRTVQLGDERAVLLPEATPATNPPSTFAKLYAFDRFGRTVLRYRTPGGNVIQLSQDNVLVVRNQSGSAITAFQCVYEAGTGSGGEPLIQLARADSDTTMPALGITIESIGNNANGFVMMQGVVVDINTSAFSSGDILYVHDTIAGGFRITPPDHPNQRQRIVRVLSSHATAGVGLVLPRQARGLPDSGYRFTDVGPLSAPPADNLDVYARNRGGRMFLDMVGPSGIDTSLQPALFGNNVTMWLPGVGTTAAIAFGISWTVAATQSHPAPAATNLLTQMKRANYATSTTAGNASGIRAAAPHNWRGNAAGLGGFFFFSRFGFVTTQSAMQFWVGLSNVTTLLAGNPSAQNHTVCIGKDQTDTNLQLIFRDAAAATKVDLGVAPADNMILDVMFFCAPNSSQITARVVRIDSPAVLADNTVHTTNLPANNVFLTAHAEIRTNATVSVVLALNRIYIENDV